jgi:hypothetical protein
MGGGRGVDISLDFTDWEIAKFLWKSMCVGKPSTDVRHVRVEVDKGHGYKHIDPAQTWPRPSMISA